MALRSSFTKTLSGDARPNVAQLTEFLSDLPYEAMVSIRTEPGDRNLNSTWTLTATYDDEVSGN